MEEMINLNEEIVNLDNATPLEVAKAVEKQENIYLNIRVIIMTKMEIPHGECQEKECWNFLKD